jgi:hypothetical protein
MADSMSYLLDFNYCGMSLAIQRGNSLKIACILFFKGTIDIETSQRDAKSVSVANQDDIHLQLIAQISYIMHLSRPFYQFEI